MSHLPGIESFRLVRLAALVCLATALFVSVPVADGVSENPPAVFSAPGASAEGEALFQSRACGFCHEKGGRKAGKGPQLMASKKTEQKMFDIIKKGRPQRGMPAWLLTFTDNQIWTIVAYIKSLDPETGE